MKNSALDRPDPIVSVIMPAFNAQSTIAESIGSVISQSFKLWELIVIDDGSKDGTSEIVKNFQMDDTRIRLFTLQKNGGLPNARNEGCNIARGEYVAFLDSDDLWQKDKLQIQILFHKQNPEIEISHTDYHFFDQHRIIKRPWKYFIEKRRDKEGLLYPNLCYQNTIGVLTVLVKRELFNSVGRFDASLWTLEDQDLWIRIAKTSKRFGYIAKALAYYRLSPGGISAKTGKYKKAYKDFLKKISGFDGVNDNLLWRSYYRYFGAIYFSKGNFKLARFYFWKSIGLGPFDYISSTTHLYIVYSFFKEKMQSF